MICGTSTGGILALGLSLNLKASEISKLYKEEGPKIFPKPKQHFGLVQTNVDFLVSIQM